MIKLESLDENGLCASLEKEKVKTQERLRIIRNLIRVLEKQKREVTEERIPGLQDHQVSTKERSCRGENAGTSSKWSEFNETSRKKISVDENKAQKNNILKDVLANGELNVEIQCVKEELQDLQQEIENINRSFIKEF